MNTKVYAFQTQKAFWIAGDGVRRYCRVSIEKLTPRTLEMSAMDMFQSGFRTVFHSPDGFSYEGRALIDEKEHLISMRVFVLGWSVLLYGKWIGDGDTRGEFVVHGAVRGLVLKESEKQAVPEHFPPAA